MADEEEEGALEESTPEIQREPLAVEKTSSPKKGAGDSSKTEAYDKEVGTTDSDFFSDSSSEYDACRRKKRKKKIRKKLPKQDWPAIPTEYNPCPHLHFKTNTLNRNVLSRDQHTDLLATPKGYRWDCNIQIRYTRKGKKKKTRRKCKKPPKQIEEDDQMFFGQFFCEIWNSLPPKLIEQLRQLLVEEFGMTEGEANDFIQQQKECAQTKVEKKPKRKQYCPPERKIGVRHKWIKDFSKVFADKVTDYIIMMLCCRRTPRVRKLAEIILNNFCDITGEKTTLNAPKTKFQRIQVFFADRIAVWLDSLMKESEDKKTKDESVEAKIGVSEKLRPKRKAEEAEGEGEGEGPKTPPSKTPSKPTSKVSSKEGSGEGSKAGSKPPSKPASKPSSKPPSKPTSNAPSKEGSKAPSAASSKQQVGEGDGKQPAADESPKGENEAVTNEGAGPVEEPTVVVEEDEEEETEAEGEAEEEGEEEGDEEEEGEEEMEEEIEMEDRIGLEMEEEEEVEEEEVLSEESEESEVISEPPPLPCLPVKDKGLVYQIMKDGSKYNVRQLSSGTVAEKVAEARKREMPVRDVALKQKPEKPLTESPLNLETMKQWADWAAKATEVAQQWTNWIDKTVASAEEKSKIKKGKVVGEDGGTLKLTKEEWKQWQARTKVEVDEITKKKYVWKRAAETWMKKTEKAAQRIGLEMETKVTNLAPEGGEKPDSLEAEKRQDQGPQIIGDEGEESPSDAPPKEGEKEEAAAAAEEEEEESPE